eukprot:9479593-Ditylum_brightwellii.AAC.1
MEMVSSDKLLVNIYQPGGALKGVVGKKQGRVLKADSNPHRLGHWSMVCLTGQDERKVYVVSSYRVAQENNDGNHTAYIQQYQIMQRKRMINPNLRRQWCIDMLAAIKQWKNMEKYCFSWM